MRLGFVIAVSLSLGSFLNQAVCEEPTVDLAKLERVISKEPAYESSPRYCLLVFGPRAAHKAWVVVDGKRLIVDRNCNGDLTEANESFELLSSCYVVPTVGGCANLRVFPLPNHQARIDVKTPDLGVQFVGFSQAEKPTFAPTPKDAPVIHFCGPISLGQYSSTLTIDPAKQDSLSLRQTAFRIMVGTAGLGEGTFAGYHCKMRNTLGPLQAEFKFPSNTEQGMPIELTTSLETSG